MDKPAHPHIGHRGRLRERYMVGGLDAFQPHEIVELLLTYVIPRRDVNATAHELVRRFGGLSGVIEAAPEELMRVPGVGQSAATLLTILPQLMKRYQHDKLGAHAVLTGYREAGEYATALFIGAQYEETYLICLNSAGGVNNHALIAQGTTDETVIYPRRVVEAALRHNAHAAILAHNHPSGSLIPSAADIETTNIVARALSGVGIALIDHVIVTIDGYTSMRKSGYYAPGQENTPALSLVVGDYGSLQKNTKGRSYV